MREKILIVDDDEYSRQYLALLVQAAGWRVQEATDGLEFLEKAPEAEPDLVLMDVVMPRMDGLEACRRFKEDPRFMDVPVVFLSSRTEIEDKIRGLDLGGSDYITKPFDEGEILARVRSQLKIRHLTQELITANAKLMEKQARIDEDLLAAGEIQRSMLPERLPEMNGVRFAWKFEPSAQVGGDIFNVLPLDQSLLSFYILDVSGHGPPSALVAVSVNQLLASGGQLCSQAPGGSRRQMLSEPVGVLQSLDREFPIERFNRYFTMFYGVLDFRSGHLAYSSAAHPPPILVRADGSVEFLEEGGSIIGIGGAVPFDPGTARLAPGDRLYLYTDGINEYENAAGEFFGRERLTETILAHRRQPAQKVLDAVYGELMRFGNGRKAADDISLLALDFQDSSAKK